MSQIYEMCKNNLMRNNDMPRFMKEKHSLFEFTKEEIIQLHKHVYVGNLFDRIVLSRFSKELVIIFSKEELKNLILESGDPLFQTTMFLYFVEHYEEYEKELYEILKFFSFPFKVSFIKELEFLCQKNSIYSQFLTSQLYFHYFNYYQDIDNEILNSIVNNFEIMEYIFKNVHLMMQSELPTKFKQIRFSKYYQELFLKYKMKIYKIFLFNCDTKDEVMEEFSVFIFLIEELLNLENLNFEDITYLSHGCFCNVYRLNQFVLKIGKCHIKHFIESSSSFAFPIFRKEIPSLNFYIEVNYLYDTKNIGEADVYSIYKKERQNGNIWLDPKPENLGRMLYKNNFYDFKIEESTLGFNGSYVEQKEIGSLSIIDLDYLWKEKDIDWDKLFINLSLYQHYEDCYQYELKLMKK